MHLATHRTRADADPPSEHRRDDAHFDQIGGAADPFQGAGGFHHQIAFPQQAFLLGHPHGQGEGAGGGALFGDQQGIDAPDQLQLAGHGLLTGDRQDWGAGPEFADVAGGGSRLGEGQDRSGVELAGNAADGLADGVGNGGGHLAIKDPPGIVALDAPGDPGHGGHRFHRVITNGGFVGEHHGVGAIQDGVSHVADLGPGGAGAAGHRIEHLGGGDDRDAQAVGLANQFFLQQRNFFGRHLDAQIAPGDHHAVAEGQDGIDGINRLEFLDFGHHRRSATVAANQIPDLLHVRGIAHEAEGDPVDLLLQAKGEVTAIFRGESPDGELHIGEVDPLVV